MVWLMVVRLRRSLLDTVVAHIEAGVRATSQSTLRCRGVGADAGAGANGEGVVCTHEFVYRMVPSPSSQYHVDAAPGLDALEACSGAELALGLPIQTVPIAWPARPNDAFSLAMY